MLFKLMGDFRERAGKKREEERPYGVQVLKAFKVSD